jgi:signal peptidase I
VRADDFQAFDWNDQPPRPAAGPRVRRLVLELVQTVVLAFLLFMAVRALAQNFRVEGSSMEPGLHNGQYLLVNKAIYYKINLDTLGKYLPFIDGGDNPAHFIIHGPNRGDVVVFKFPQQPSRDFIKRVIGLPGDTVEINSGIVKVNGVILEEPYIRGHNTFDYATTLCRRTAIFVLGDNRNNSSDSRNWGFVPEANIIGKAQCPTGPWTTSVASATTTSIWASSLSP